MTVAGLIVIGVAVVALCVLLRRTEPERSPDGCPTCGYDIPHLLPKCPRCGLKQ